MLTRRTLRCVIPSAVLLLIPAALPAIASAKRTLPGVQSLSRALAPDGRVDARSGAFDARGFQLSLGDDGEPRFAAAAAAAPPPVAGPNLGDAWWDDRFGNTGIPVAKISAVAVSGNDIYVGGDFLKLDSTGSQFPANNVAHWNGRRWEPLGTGAANGVTGGLVNAIAVDGDNVYVGGSFTAAGGQPANRIARWDGTGWSALGTGATNTAPTTTPTPEVRALTVAGGKLLVGGTFDLAGGVTAHSVAMWDGAAWAPLGDGVRRCLACSPQQSGDVHAFAVIGTKTYIGGRFDKAGAVLTKGVAQWSGTTWSSLGGAGISNGGPDPRVNALAVNGTTLYAGGEFTAVNGVAAAGVAKYASSAWTALGTGVAGGFVKALAYSGDRLLAGGTFTSAGGAPALRGAAWNGTAWSQLGPGFESELRALTTIPGTTSTLVGGLFVKVGGQSLNRIAKWNGSKFTGFGIGVSTGECCGSLLAVAASSSVAYVGGPATYAGWTPIKSLARLSGSSWTSMADGVPATATINAILVDGADVYVGGAFSEIGGVPAANIARWDGAAWHALGAGTSAAVRALLKYGDKLWVGGDFLNAGAAPADHVATWDPAGGAWAAVGGNMGFHDGSISALAGLPAPYDHYVVVGGSFQNVSDDEGNLYLVRGLVAFDTDAQITDSLSGWSTLNGGVSDGYVRALEMVGMNLYVGGTFTTAGTVETRGLAVYDFLAETAWWSSPGEVTGGSGEVLALERVGSDLFVGGDFAQAGPIAASHIARYTPANGRWSALGAGLRKTTTISAVRGLAQSKQGLFVVGSFEQSGRQIAHNIALWKGTATVADLSVTQKAVPTTVETGTAVTFTSVVTNTANRASAPATLTATLPADAEFVSATAPDGGTCTRAARKVTCDLGAIGAGASRRVVIVVKPLAPGFPANVVTVTPADVSADNSVTTGVEVLAKAKTTYVSVRDSGFSPASSLVTIGGTLQFNVLGPGAHSVRDASGMGLFDSGMITPVAGFAYRYTAAGSYPVGDAAGANVATIGVRPTLGSTTTTAGTPVKVTMATSTPPAGFVLDLEVLRPGAGAWAPLATGTRTRTFDYTPTTAGSHQLRARLRKPAAGAAAGFSPPVTVKVT